MIKVLRNSIITGLIIILPLTVTLFILYFLITKIGSPVSQTVIEPLIKQLGFHISDSPLWSILLNFIATLFVMVIIAVVGFFSKFFFGKLAISVSESLIHKIPIAKQIYNTVKQIVDTFSKQNKAVFQQVVMVEFPSKGLYSIGFLTSTAKGEIQSKTGETVVNVFVPTTPNPTSGFLIMVPKQNVTYLDMSVSEGMKLIISFGAVTPNWTPAEIDGK